MAEPAAEEPVAVEEPVVEEPVAEPVAEEPTAEESRPSRSRRREASPSPRRGAGAAEPCRGARSCEEPAESLPRRSPRVCSWRSRRRGGCCGRGRRGGGRGGAAPRVKPAVPGAHLEVDIVPEGVDPLGARGPRRPLRDRGGRGGGQPPRRTVEEEPLAAADLHGRDRPRRRAPATARPASARRRSRA